jgi:hypothetical protein
VIEVVSGHDGLSLRDVLSAPHRRVTADRYSRLSFNMRLLVRDCPTYLQNVLLDVQGASVLQAAIHAGRSIPLATLTVTTIKDHPDVRIVGERRLKTLVTLGLTARHDEQEP